MLPLLLQTAGGLEETIFKSLDDLIRHYKRRNQGLTMHLRHSVKRKTAMLIQPQKPPELPRTPMSLPEQDHDYESTSHILSSGLLFTASFWISSVLDLLSVSLQMLLTHLNTWKSCLPERLWHMRRVAKTEKRRTMNALKRTTCSRTKTNSE